MSRTARTPKKDKAFLDALRSGATVKSACVVAGVGRTTVYERRSTDTAFAAAWDDAESEGSDVLEQEAFRRAVEGNVRYAFSKDGEQVEVREYSDTLLIFLLKGRKPERFRERYEQQHSGPNGGPIPIQYVVIEKPPVDEGA